jgi:hypothetical protein
MVRRYFPGEDPLGKRVTVRFGPPTAREIVGIVGDVRHAGLDTEPRPEVFIPHAQYPFGSMTFVVRTAGEPLALLPAVKEAVWAVNPLYQSSRIAWERSTSSFLRISTKRGASSGGRSFRVSRTC